MQIAVIVVLTVYVDYPLPIGGEKLTLSILRNLPIAAYALHFVFSKGRVILLYREKFVT